jgi:hypothetical protein
VSDAEWQAAHQRLTVARAQYERDTHGGDGRIVTASRNTCCRDLEAARSAAAGCTFAVDRMGADASCSTPARRTTNDEVIAAAKTMFDASQQADGRDRWRRDLASVERQQARLTDAIAAGGYVPILVERLRATEAKRRELAERLADRRHERGIPAWPQIEQRMRQSLADWRSLLTGDVAEARTGFRQLLTAPILLTPFVENGCRGVSFEGRIGLSAIFGGAVVTKLASPTGLVERCNVPFMGTAA